MDHLVDSQRDHGVNLIGPVAGGSSWQANDNKGFDVSCFGVNWATQTLVCPGGKSSQNWRLRQDQYGHSCVQIRFAPADCQPCVHRSDCTKSKRGVRVVTLRTQLEYETLQAARARQETDEFKATYRKRAGIEGTISQGTRSFDLRRSRYIGLAKTRLQHLVTAAAMNVTRVVVWLLEDKPKPPTHRSPFAALAPST